jgi:uncharacterized protein (TIGR02118 family)
LIGDIKVIEFVRRRPDVDVDEFRGHWITARAHAAEGIPGLRRYTQNLADDGSYRDGRAPAIDAVDELWFDSYDSARIGLESSEWQVLQESTQVLIAGRNSGRMLTHEVWMKDGDVRSPADGGVRLIQFMRKRADLDLGVFERYWREEHGPLAALNPFVKRYVQCHVPAQEYLIEPPPFDGSPMTWFDSRADLRASAKSQALRDVQSDEEEFIVDPEHVPYVVAVERVVLDRRTRKPGS